MVQGGRVTATDWEQLRDASLRALAESPDAFGSTLTRERRHTDEQWRSWPWSAIWFIAFDGVRPVGVGRQLMDAVVAEATGHGASAVSLHVTDRNLAARKAYERYSFVATGEREHLACDRSRRRELLRLAVAGNG